MVFHVAVMEEGDEGFEAGDGEMEKVVGYAIWKRYGESEEAKKWKRRRSWMMCMFFIVRNGFSLFELTVADIESTFLALTERYSTFTRGDPCLDYDRVSTYISKSATAFKDLPEMIRLVAFAVDPAFQHHGIGSKLIEWGLEQAGKEDCPVGLTSSQGAKGFYEKKGFRRWCSIDVEGVVEVPVLVWELESVVNS